MLRPGVAVDRYVVDVEIGRGGMAVVYRVHHRTLGSTHALKVLYLPSPALNERVVQEGRIQASLRHVNVVAVTDVVDVDGAPGLIMDYVHGDNLEVWLEKAERPLEESLAVFRQVVAGVRAAHDRGLVHRDLKPANVLMSEVDGRWTPMITDFGLAKAIRGAVGENATRSNMSMGTPSYMAPEQIRNARAVDQRADIFSLGALLYRMLVGRQPFLGDDVLEIMLATSEGSFTPPEHARPGLPEHVARAISACLAPDPRHRLESCERLLAALDGAVPAGELWARGSVAPGNVTLSPMSYSDLPMGDSGPRRPGALPSADASYDGPVPVSLELEDLAPPPEEPRPWPWLAALALLVLVVGVAAIWRAQEVEASVQVRADSAAPPEASAAPDPPPEVSDPGPPEVEEPPAPVAPEPAPVSARPPKGRADARVVEEARPAPEIAEETATVSVTGDAVEVWLEAGGRRVSVGQQSAVPTGEWQIHARFPGAEAAVMGRAVLRAGAEVTISCTAAFSQCRSRAAP